MRALDTSVVVPLLARWHEAHALVTAAVRRDDRVAGHVLLESYSVLTRLPPPLRADPSDVATALAARFPETPLSASPEALRQLPSRLAELGVVGGAVYDALVALTVREHDGVLLTLDARAAQTYRKLGIPFELAAA